ncbi:MAG TPA: hypothetical protein PK771_10655 [Spirochaetota bacterium]|nr:hypothetical protein [Spirochaetota bacterium]
MKLFILFFSLFLFVFNIFSVEYLQIYSKNKDLGKDIVIRFEVGEKYNSSFKLDMFKVFITPQIACWTEDSSGNLIETLYVTNSFAKQNWLALVKLDEKETYRMEVLPYWFSKYLKKTSHKLSYENPLPDSLTSATPFTNFYLNTKITERKDIYILVEVNMAFDNNNHYPLRTFFGNPNNNGTSGQPPLIYKAKIDIEKSGETELKLIGHSNLIDKEANIITDISKITTAKQIINKVVLLVP